MHNNSETTNRERKSKRNENIPCTLESLNKILNNVRPAKNFSSSLSYFDLRDYDEVFPNLLIGNYVIAKDVKTLFSLGISHVLNCAEPCTTSYPEDKVEPNSLEAYSSSGISYKGLQIDDIWSFPIKDYFDHATFYIHHAIEQNGKVLVNCMMGISRSSTIVLAYLIRYQGMSLDQALTTLRKKREIRPNMGFLQQLIEYDNRLKQGGGNRNNNISSNLNSNLDITINSSQNKIKAI